MTIKKEFLVLGVVAIFFVGGLIWYLAMPPVAVSEAEIVDVPQENALGRELSETELVTTVKEVLAILNELHFITQETTGSGEAESTSELIMDMTLESLSDKIRTDSLIPRARKLAESDNEVIQTVGLGMLANMTSLSKAETDLAAYLREVDPIYPDVSEFQYQLATYSASQKESFRMLALGSGQLPGLFWDFADAENPTGPIPYKMSLESRKELLAEIDRLFADSIAQDRINHDLTGNTNVVIFIVREYINALKPDTYEEARVLDNQN